MKKAILATLVLALGAGTASAAPDPNPPFELRGSDTLFTLTQEVLSLCGIPATTTVYLGGGSSLGEGEMEAGNQQIAPMSRFIDATSCTAAGPLGQGCRVALDGLALFADDAEANACDTLRYTGFMEVQDLNGVAGIDNGAGGACPNCVDGPDADSDADDYEFSDWRDVLRIVYGGQHAHLAHDACNELDPSRSPVGQKFCNSDVRHTLVNNWGNLFEEGAACGVGDADNCTQLKHAFRRDDVSGTTDTFLSLLALPAIVSGSLPNIVPQRTFCNGLEQEDDDPVRRGCSDPASPGTTDGNTTGVQVCASVPGNLRGPITPSGWYGGPTVNPATVNEANLGLVLPQVIPPVDPFNDSRFCSAAPTGGAFRFVPMPPGIGAAQQRCPDGNGRVGGQCQWPAIADAAAPGGFVYGCVNRKLNRPGARAIANMDGRVYNLIARNANGTIKTVPRVNPNTDVESQVPVVGSFYRIHQTRVMAGGVATSATVGCQEPDATHNIACLVHASPCSIGFAGLTGDADNPNKPLALRTPLVGGGSVLPTEANVRRLNDPTGAGCAAAGDFDLRYPLSRALWVNTVKGFESAGDPDIDFDNITDIVDSSDPDAAPDLTTREQDLISCFCNRAIVDQAVNTVGFITLDETPVGTTPIRTCP